MTEPPPALPDRTQRVVEWYPNWYLNYVFLYLLPVIAILGAIFAIVGRVDWRTLSSLALALLCLLAHVMHGRATRRREVVITLLATLGLFLLSFYVVRRS